jgi:hypothetical protein
MPRIHWHPPPPPPLPLSLTRGTPLDRLHAPHLLRESKANIDCSGLRLFEVQLPCETPQGTCELLGQQLVRPRASGQVLGLLGDLRQMQTATSKSTGKDRDQRRRTPCRVLSGQVPGLLGHL